MRYRLRHREHFSCWNAQSRELVRTGRNASLRQSGLDQEQKRTSVLFTVVARAELRLLDQFAKLKVTGK